MRRVLLAGASLALALLVITCVDKTITGPGRSGAAMFNFAALAPPPGGAPVPVESLEITLRRPADASVALDTVVGFDIGNGDSAVVRLSVVLLQSPEDFHLSVRAFGAGITWYTASASVRISTGAAAPTPLVVQYVGPGVNAARVVMAPADTTAVGGVPFSLHAVVYDSGGKPITGVPVGYRLSDTSQARVIYPTPYTALFTGSLGLRDSVWVVAETPTHVKDSTRVHIVAPAATLVKKSGDLQTSIVNAALPAPLLVRVLDGLGGGFKGDTVRWTLTAGAATLTAPFSISDDTGYASMAVTPMALGGLTVQAAVAGLTGSPVTFTETAISGTISTVTVAPKVDTLGNGATLQYVAVAKDALGNVVNTTFGWTSTVPSIATVGATTGLATAVAGDSTKIIATAGGIADTARLYVRALKALMLSPADTVITAVGDSLLLKPSAVDNFGVPLTSGLTIRYLSASPTIATVNGLTGRVRILGPGNAVILVRDSVATSDSLVRGSATLRVNQVIAGIVNSPRDPDSLLVGISGQSQIVARAVDRNGFTVPNTTLGWASRIPSLLVVSGTGVVTGVALGTAYVVDSVGAFKDSTKVAVVVAPPKQIQWTFDSTAVGNGGNVSIGITVTQSPALAPLTISISSSDSTIAKASPHTVTIGAGLSGTAAVIYGLRPGRVVLTATDTSGLGYASKDLTIGVVSTIEVREIASPCCRQPYVYLNQNETHKAQVWLSDPAPPGGLGITFEYGQPGTSVVTPSPAVIPAGQLSADIVFQGLKPGLDGQPDVVTPTSGGYAGKFSYVYVASNVLQLALPYPYTVGVGQTFQPYVQFTYAMDHALIVSTRLSPSLGTTPDTVTIPTGSTYRYFTATARTPGADTLSVGAPGWVSADGVMTFTTPRLQIAGTTSLVAGSPNGYWYASTEDSLFTAHPVADTLVVAIVSRNPVAVTIDASTAKVLPGSASTPGLYTLRPVAGSGGDSAWIVATAPGYLPDSMKVYVTKPALTLGLSYPYTTGVGTLFQNAGYVSIPFARTDTFTVVFSHTRRGLVSGPDSVSIPKGQTVAYFDISGDTLGTDTIGVTRATSYQLPAAQTFQVVPIHVAPYYYPSTLYTISRPQLVNVYVHDSLSGYSHPLVAPLRVTLSSTNPQAFTLDSGAVTVPAGGVTSNYDTLRVGTVPGSGRIQITAPGSSPDSSGVITLNATPLTLNIAYPYQAGRLLRLAGNYVTLPDIAPNAVTVTLAGHNPVADTLSATTVTIAKNSTTSSPFEIVAVDSTGSDSITATATGFGEAFGRFTAAPAALQIQYPGTSHLTTEPAQRLVLYTALRIFGYQQNTATPVTVGIKSSDSTVIRIDSAGSVPRGDSGASVVATGLYYGYVRVRYAGPGTAYLRISAPGFSSDSTAAISVTGPSVHLGNTTITVGQGQVFNGQYAYVDNPVTGSPLVVSLARSDSAALQANQVFGLSASSVVIPVGSQYSDAVDITGNSAGAAQLIARASGYSQATATVVVGQPRLAIGSKTLSLYVGAPATNVYVYTEDQANNTRNVASSLDVKDSSTDATVAIGDAVIKTIAPGTDYTTFALTGLKQASVAIVYTAPNYRPDTTRVSVDTAQLAVGSGVTVPAGQTTQMLVSIPFYATSPVTVILTSSDPTALTVPATVTIPQGGYYAYFAVTGVTAGSVSVSAHATGFRAATPVSVTVQ